MSSSMLDSLEILWVSRGRTPDWEAMRKKADGIKDQDERDEAHEAIGSIEVNWDGRSRARDVDVFALGPLDVMMGFDTGWLVGLLDEQGILVAGGFYE